MYKNFLKTDFIVTGTFFDFIVTGTFLLALSDEEIEYETITSTYCYDRQNKNLLVQYNSDGSIIKFVYGNSLISSETTSDDAETVNKVYHYDLRGSAVRITDLNGKLLGSSKWVSPT